ELGANRGRAPACFSEQCGVGRAGRRRLRGPPPAEPGPRAQPMPAELPLPSQPSIAILPFRNMSGEAEQEYFSDGITEDIITDLSRFRNLLVIARNSSFAYKGKSVNVATIARELGVEYVLEGSVRRSGRRVRITTYLLAMVGETDEAVKCGETAVRLNPRHPDWYLAYLSTALFNARRYPEALAVRLHSAD